MTNPVAWLIEWDAHDGQEPCYRARVGFTPEIEPWMAERNPKVTPLAPLDEVERLTMHKEQVQHAWLAALDQVDIPKDVRARIIITAAAELLMTAAVTGDGIRDADPAPAQCSHATVLVVGDQETCQGCGRVRRRTTIRTPAPRGVDPASKS